MTKRLKPPPCGDGLVAPSTRGGRAMLPSGSVLRALRTTRLLSVAAAGPLVLLSIGWVAPQAGLEPATPPLPSADRHASMAAIPRSSAAAPSGPRG